MISEKEKNMIINSAYGRNSLWEKFRTFVLLQKNSDARFLYENHKKVKLLIRNSKKNELPKNVENGIFNRVDSKTERNSVWITNSVFAIASIFLIVSLLTFSFLKNRGIDTSPFSNEEVVLAEQETLASLKLISKIFNKTKDKYVVEILEEKVSEPINKSLKIIEIITTQKGEVKWRTYFIY